jgi:starch synthase
MRIVHISAELAPIAKIGGLGDVLHGLSKALLAKGDDITIIMPKYDTLDLRLVRHLKVIETQHFIQFDKTVCNNTLWQGVVDTIPVILIESHDPKEFFDRGTVYGCPDDIDRFLYFSLAALEYVRKLNCDVIHLHDWHVAIIAVLIKKFYPKIRAKVVLTIHNLSYQGICTQTDLDQIGLFDPLLLEGVYCNLLKGGIIYADFITTVSPTYAQELLKTPISGDLQNTLKEHASKLIGILNGIDYSYWNPENDPYLPFHYSSHSPQPKELVKKELKARLSLAEEDAPLVCAITRLVPQKGPELIKAAILRTLEWGGQFVLLGSALDEKTHSQFYNLKRKLAGSHHVHLELTYNEELSHLVFAAGDLFLIPSLFEPCGLTQLIAMRYGTVPVARATGGLSDTVFDGKNGFTFEPYTIEGLFEAMDHALKTWYDEPEEWQAIQSRGMKEDYSWDKPAEAYRYLYRQSPLSINNLST